MFDIQIIGLIKLNAKLLRKRNAGNPHVAFEAAGDGNRALTEELISCSYCAIARPYENVKPIEKWLPYSLIHLILARIAHQY